MKYIRQFAEYSTATDAAKDLFVEKHGCPFIFKVDNNLELNCGEGDYFTCLHFTNGLEPVFEHLDGVVNSQFGHTNYPNLTEVFIGSNVTNIADGTFSNCYTLTSANMNNVQGIGVNAFQYCSLTSVSMPKVTSIGNGAFKDCSTLTSVSMPNATSIYSVAFRGCSSLTSIDMPKVTSIGAQAFYNCSALTSVDIPNVEIVGGGAFQYCSSLTSVNMPNATSIIDNAFQYCSALTSVYLPDIVPTLSNTNAFSATPTTLKFYVSSQSVKEAYLAATNWKSFETDKYVVLT